MSVFCQTLALFSPSNSSSPSYGGLSVTWHSLPWASPRLVRASAGLAWPRPLKEPRTPSHDGESLIDGETLGRVAAGAAGICELGQNSAQDLRRLLPTFIPAALYCARPRRQAGGHRALPDSGRPPPPNGCGHQPNLASYAEATCWRPILTVLVLPRMSSRIRTRSQPDGT